MSRTWLLNLGVAALSLALSTLSALPTNTALGAKRKHKVALAAGTKLTRQDGRDGLIDASGFFVPIAPFRRILSGSTVTDSLLLTLAEPDRVLAFTNYATDSAYAYRYAGKPIVPDMSRIEEIVAQKPDLVLFHNVGSNENATRLRHAGLTVFDLGQMKGLATLPDNIITVATLLGRPEEGARLARALERRMAALARHIPKAEHPSGMYVAVYGDNVYGGTIGTSYHDVLTAAGVRDVAASRFADWPKYSPEQLLQLNPEVVVTHYGMGKQLCDQPGLLLLRACSGRGGRVIEVDGKMIGDPSFTMLEAAEAIYEAVHGEPDPVRLQAANELP